MRGRFTGLLNRISISHLRDSMISNCGRSHTDNSQNLMCQRRKNESPLWISKQGTAEAYFSAYVLEYAKFNAEITRDTTLVRTYVEECRTRAPRLERRYSFEWLAREPIWFPFIHHNELGKWDEELNFFKSEATLTLKRSIGIIKSIVGPERGTISIDGLDAFFVPGAKLGQTVKEGEFLKGRDEGAIVDCHLGFSFDGLRAWNVRRHGALV